MTPASSWSHYYYLGQWDRKPLLMKMVFVPGAYQESDRCAGRGSIKTGIRDEWADIEAQTLLSSEEVEGGLAEAIFLRMQTIQKAQLHSSE